MNAILNTDYCAQSAHPLFPPDQTFLWLPGFKGKETAYCTYNEFRPDRRHENSSINMMSELDDNGACYTPPYPVSLETHISWHTDVSPPYPFHPVPITRSLSPEDLIELGKNVIQLRDGSVNEECNPLSVIRNDHKPFILAALAHMGLLPERTVTLQLYSLTSYRFTA
jgi:hypothetical protein